MTTNCEYCANYIYDDEDGNYYCEVNMDEDDYMRLLSSSFRNCPYYQSNDEYRIVRKQM